MGPSGQARQGLQGKPVTVSVGQPVTVQATDRPAQSPLLHTKAGLVVQARADTPAVLQTPELLRAGAVKQLLTSALGQAGKPPLQCPTVAHGRAITV